MSERRAVFRNRYPPPVFGSDRSKARVEGEAPTATGPTPGPKAKGVELEDEVEWDEESQPTLRRRTTPSEPQVSRGASVAEHVEQHMHNSSIADHVEEYLDHGVDKSVEEHLGFRTTKSSKTGDRSSSVHQFVETLRDPDSVRKAIIINEVLMPPKALRVRR